MFKILINMTIGLAKFLALWLIVILMIASMMEILFIRLESFHDLFSINVMIFLSSLGSWDMGIYVLENEKNEGIR